MLAERRVTPQSIPEFNSSQGLIAGPGEPAPASRYG